MTSCLPLLLTSLLAAGDGGRTEADHHADVDHRGDQGMGFSHERTEHHFTLTSDGGLISASALDPADTATRDSIRAHFGHIAKAFSSGDFELPMFIHDQVPPGADTMQRLRKKISYRSENTARGARVVIRTTDPEARTAIHSFLRFQISDHRTGDSPEVQR
jgi:hypothetical protein